ncbi:HepT-like ribonuclease domain-containing protein [Methanolobus tindarius]
MRQLEIIGEATKNLSSSTTESYPQIPWKEICRKQH